MKRKTDKASGISLDNKSLNSTLQKKKVAKDSEPFNFIKSFIGHIKDVFNIFYGKNFSSIKNSAFVELGRTEEEKEQIEEMCARVDEEFAFLADLRTSGLSPKEWIKKKGDEILKDCSTEEREEVLHVVKEESITEVEEETDALELVIKDIQENQEDSKEE